MKIHCHVVLFPLLILILCSSCSLMGAPDWTYEKEAIELSYRSDSQLNSYQGNPHTLMLCLYQLRDPNAFNQLVDEEEGLSKLLECNRFDPSVTVSRRLVVYPGKVKTEILDRAEGTKYVGVVAGYYSLKKERAVRFFSVSVNFFTNRPRTREINLYLGPQDIQKLKGD